MGSRITVKGQVTIPKEIRDRLGLVPGDEVEFDQRPDGIVVVTAPRARKRRRSFADARGSVDLGMSTDEFMRFLRGD